MALLNLYRVGLGWGDVATTPLRPQPKCPLGVTPARLRLAANITSVPDGQLTCTLEYNGAITNEKYDSLLVQFGLEEDDESQITITLPNEKNRTFLYYHGTVHRPRERRYEFGDYKNLLFVITDLVEAEADFNEDFSEDFRI
jgi:hypothetical protein